jgi:hypothetical protein
VARSRRRLIWILVGLVLLATLGLLALRLASGHVPKFYRDAIRRDAPASHRSSDQMLQRATALASDLKRGGRWQAVFTAEEINGWLAVDFVENHADSLPPGFRDPRVAIEPGRLMLACRYHRGIIDSVLWMSVEPYLIQPGVLAIRIREVRAGWLPVSMQQVLDAIDEAVRRSDLKIEWRQADSDPVAVVSLPPQRQSGEEFTLDTLRLSQDKIALAGTSRKRK